MARLPSTAGDPQVTDVNLKTDLEKVADHIVEIDTVAQALDDDIIQTCNSFEPEIRSVAINIGDVQLVAQVSGGVTTLATNIDGINTVAANLGAILNCSTNMAILQLLDLRMADLEAITTSLPNIDLVATHMDSVIAVENGIPYVVNCVEHMEDIIKVSDNMNNTLKYLGAYSQAPTERPDGTPLQDGDYYLNTILNALVYYNLGSNSWFEVDPQEVLSARDEAVTAAEEAVLSADRSEAAAVGLELAETNAAQSASEALASENAAGLSEGNAKTSETNAKTSETNAEASAQRAEEAFDSFDDVYLGAFVTAPQTDNDGDPLEVGMTYWSTPEETLFYFTGSVWESPDAAAQDSANKAATSASEASASESAALVSANNASNSETASSASESAAGVSATQASTSASNAASSASGANQSKLDAQSAAVQAANSEARASSSESNAASSAVSALDSKEKARVSEVNALASESKASTSETNAATSETNASTSAANALAEADRAADAAEQAATSAASLNDIRYSKLDNPLTHLFKKNKLVDTLQGELTWTRDSGATYVDQYGIVQYSPSTNATNLLLWSEDFSNAAWGKNRISAEIVGYVSSIALEKITATSTETGTFALSQTTPSLSGGRYTISIFARAGDVGFIGLVESTLDVRATLNLSTGEIIDSTGLLNQDGTTSAIYIKDLDLWRWSITFDVPDATPLILNFTSQTSLDIGITSSHVTGDFMFMSAPQVEQSSVANGYVKTEATSVTGTSSVGIDQSRQEKEGWLIEGASTNLLLWSEDLSEAAWKVIGASVEGGYAISLSGEQDASKVEGLTNTFARVYQALTGVVGTFTFSGYFKADSLDELTIAIFDDGTNIIKARVYIDLTNGEVLNWSNSYPIVTAMKDGWFKVSITIDLDSGTTSQVSIYSGSHNTNTLGSILVWGTQWEELPFASSYIPTTDSAVTRAADVVEVDGIGNLPLSSELSLSVKVNLQGGGFARVIHGGYSESLNIDADTIAMRSAYPNQNAQIYVGGNATGEALFTLVAKDTVFTLTRRDKSDNETSGNSTFTGNSTPVSDLRFGAVRGSGASPLYGYMSDFRVYDFALNDSEIKFLAGE